MGHSIAFRARPLSPRIAYARALNDTLRRHYIGGRTVLTAGIAYLPAHDLTAILWAVSKFDAFDANLDSGDHSVGYLEIHGYQILFKIDGGNTGLVVGDDAIETGRVMTVMLAEEY